MSCNGCRVLRKGCAEDCALRPCLQWIDSSESQANATLFLAKFYGRAGLINLINAGPAHLHPETFKSLLYEACGRIIDPVNGSVGLMSSDNWDRCQAAVEAVLLRGTPVLMTQLSGDHDSTATAAPGQYPIIPLHGCDIRHLRKNSDASVHRIRSRNRFKRSADHGKSQLDSFDATEFMSELESKFTITGWNCGGDYKNFEEEVQERAPSHDSLSVETVELALANRDDPAVCGVKPEPESCEIELDLTLRLNPIYMSASVIEVFDGET